MLARSPTLRALQNQWKEFKEELAAPPPPRRRAAFALENLIYVQASLC